MEDCAIAGRVEEEIVLAARNSGAGRRVGIACVAREMLELMRGEVRLRVDGKSSMTARLILR